MLKFSRISHSGLGALWAVQPSQISYSLYISQIPDTWIHSFIPLISPKRLPDFTNISPRYPQFIHQNTSPRYLQDIHHISPRYQKDTPKVYPQDIPIDMMMRLSSGHFWGGVVGYPERDVWKKKEQKDCFGGILSIGFSQCICVLCSFNWFSLRNSLAHSLHVKFDCYFQSLKPEIVRLQPVILFNIFSTFKTIKSVIATSPSFMYLTIYHISVFWSKLQKKTMPPCSMADACGETCKLNASMHAIIYINWTNR